MTPDVRDYRGIADAIVTDVLGGGVVAVLSPRRGEGRSTVAAGLATALGEGSGGPVLLVDLDLERPSQAARFGVSPVPDLEDGLAGCLPVTEVATRIGARLWLVAARTAVPPTSAAWLHDVAERAPLGHWRAHFTWTVVDLPPVLDVPGVVPVAAQCDGWLLVGRHRATRIGDLERVAALLPAPPLGCVMTAAPSSSGWFSHLLRG